MAIEKLDYLIHPGFQKGGKERYELWKKRIDKIAKDETHYLAMELPADNVHSRDKENIRHILEYAKEKLGKRLIAKKDSSYEKKEDSHEYVAVQVRKIGYDRNKIKVNIYGEYAEACVLSPIRHFLPLIVPRPRIRRRDAISVLFHLSTHKGAILSKAISPEDLQEIKAYTNIYLKSARFNKDPYPAIELMLKLAKRKTN
jgi:hypothetical protein